MSTLTITVHDSPRPQGSKRHVGRGILVEQSDVKTWREAVKQAATTAMALDGWWLTQHGPVVVHITFTFRRPKGHWRTGRNAHLLKDSAPAVPNNTSHGDIDKLCRGVLDALTAAGVWADDCLVADLHAAKRWSEQAGARIDVTPMTSPWTPDQIGEPA